MENFLFKARRVDNGELVEGMPIESNIDCEGYKSYMFVDWTVKNTITLITGKASFGKCVEVIPETIIQIK